MKDIPPFPESMLTDLSLAWGKQTVSFSITEHLSPVVISDSDRRITL